MAKTTRVVEMKDKSGASEYQTIGKFIGYKVDTATVVLKGLLTLEGAGYEVVLFYAKDTEISYAKDMGWAEPFASGHAKLHDDKDSPISYWAKAYIPENNNIALTLQLSSATDKTEKHYINLFYIKGSEEVLEGKVQVKLES